MSEGGLAQERTFLAWRRTGLALLVGSVTIARLTSDVLGAVVWVPALVGAVLAAWAVHAAPRSGLRDGRLPAVVAAVAAGLGTGEILAVLVRLL